MSSSKPSLHFIGIGGIGVSAVARIALGRGYPVSGSDVRQSQLTDTMVELGATVRIGHDPSHIDGADIVVVSTAIPEHNVELVAARERGVTTRHRSELLAMLLSESRSIGVTGTHGKGTTSSMISVILDEAGWEPGFVIGGLLLNYGINARPGAGEWMVAEVDESDGTHKNIPTNYMVCNFLEADHLNYYEDLDDIIDSMARVVADNEGLEALFVNGDCEGNRTLLEKVDVPSVTYGVESDCDFRATIVDPSQSPTRFTVNGPAGDIGEFELHLPGLYNVTNATGAIAVAYSLGVPVESIRQGIKRYQGLENRFTVVDADGLYIVKDYNSHPTAIRKVLESARVLSDGKVISVFKPYRYTLTNYLKDEYATAFHGSDLVVITTMYAANEDPIPGIDTQFVVDLLRNNGLEVAFVPDLDDVVPFLDERVETGDQVLFFGGDDFFQRADAWAATRKGQG